MEVEKGRLQIKDSTPLGGVLAPSWGPYRPPRRPKNRPQGGGIIDTVTPFFDFHLGRPLGTDLRPILSPSWAHLGLILGPSWAILGSSWAILGPFWAILGSSWAILGLSWAILGPSWVILGPSWAILGPSWAILGSSWAILGPYRVIRRPCWDTSSIEQGIFNHKLAIFNPRSSIMCHVVRILEPPP